MQNPFKLILATLLTIAQTVKSGVTTVFTPQGETHGQSRGMIRNVMIAIVSLALFGWIANIFLNIIPSDNDVLGVISTLEDWGPDIIKMVVAAIIALVMAYVLNIFDRV